MTERDARMMVTKKTRLLAAVPIVQSSDGQVKVTSVNTLNRAGKRVRTRYGYGQRDSQKRAIVTVAEGQSIDIFGN